MLKAIIIYRRFFVGRDSPEKGLSLALEIFSQIKVENKRLDVFGPTLAPQKYQYLLEQGAVQLHGFCDREKIEKLNPQSFDYDFL